MPPPQPQIVPEFVTKIIQVFDCKVARHGNMIVGRTGSGKSEAWKCLQRALGRLRKEEPDDDRFQKVSVRSIAIAFATQLSSLFHQPH